MSKNNWYVLHPNQLGWMLALSVIVLTFFGNLVIFTSSSVTAQQNFGDLFYFLKKQSITTLLGLLSFVLIQFIPIRFFERLNLVLFFATALLLFLTLNPYTGHTVNGASRWLSFGGLTFQPVELAKLSIILFLSKSLSRPKVHKLDHLKALLTHIFPLVIFATALMLQPDFGSTLLLCGITFLLLYVRGLSIRYVVGCILLCLIGIVIAIWHAPYRMARFMSFLDPWQSAQSGGFQIIQSYLGFYNGGLFGLGLGESRQKLFFLPEAHTDFIMSVIGEELGIAGVIFVIGMFAYITCIGLKIMSLQRENFRKFLAFGLTSLIAIQASINMGVSMGLLPTKGMPLPFVSHGSSSLIVFLWVAALLVKLAIETEVPNDRPKSETNT